MDNEQTFTTPGAIVADSETEGGPIELWVDWEPYVDHGVADRREGNAWVREGVLFVAGGEKIRRFEGLGQDVLADINRLGGMIVAANVYGPVSYLTFPPMTPAQG